MANFVASVSGTPLPVAVVVLLFLFLQLQQYCMFQACKRSMSESEERLREGRIRSRWESILSMSRLAASVSGKLAAVRKIEADIRGLRKEVDTLLSELSLIHI